MSAETPAQKPQPQTSATATIHYAGPTLIFPVEETVYISGLKKVEFRWKPADVPFEVFCYLFRIYRGRDMSQKSEVHAEQVSGLDTATEVSADHFEDGEVYTWYIKEVNNGPPIMFSDPVFQSFRIIKKTDRQGG